jgi:membrane-anchored mycosin MYCP
MRRGTTVLAVMAVVGVLGSTAGSALAAPPVPAHRQDADTAPGPTGPPEPAVDPPADGTPAPFNPTQQRNQCVQSVPDDDTADPIAQQYLGIRALWKFSRGQGQKVAVIDTGVTPTPRLGDRLIAGGDYVFPENGMHDCDGHGTYVAGIIAASDTGKGFAGVAPDAQVITIRAESSAYEPQGTVHKQEGEPAQGYGPLPALAAAIVHATDLGATVINISLTYCAAHQMQDDDIGAAAEYAYDHNVVVVAASGNFQNGECPDGNHDLIDPQHPDVSPWSNVTVNSAPARYSQYVLAVGSIDPKTGQPSKFSVPGPWVGIAAPGEDIVSLQPDGPGITSAAKKFDNNGNQTGTETIQGTSFASPYVAGVAALVRARFPQLSAGQVISRLEQTAHAPGGGWDPYIGYGIIDPPAALTDDLSGTMQQADSNGVKTVHPESRQLPIPSPPPPVDHTARNAALIAAGAVLLALALGLLAANPIGRRKD